MGTRKGFITLKLITSIRPTKAILMAARTDSLTWFSSLLLNCAIILLQDIKTFKEEKYTFILSFEFLIPLEDNPPCTSVGCLKSCHHACSILHKCQLAYEEYIALVDILLDHR